MYTRISRKCDALLLILLLAFVIRLAFSWHPGYGFDIGVYQGWARSAVMLGAAESYVEQIGGNMLPDYPPFSILLLKVTGHLYNLFIDGEFDLDSLKFRIFIKLPAILADVLVCVGLYALVRRWRNHADGLLAALIYAVHPAAIFDSAIWGQTDVIYSLFLFLAVLFWVYRHQNLSAAMLALSVLTKIQGVVLFPFFFFLLLHKPKDLLKFTTVGIFTTLLVLTPYMVGNVLQNIVDVYTGAVGAYSHIAVGAYNFWWSLLADRAWQLEDTELLFGWVPFRKASLVLFGLLYSFILFTFRKGLKVRSVESIFFCAAMLCMAFFMFLTQMHERYLFPFVVLGVPLMFMNKRIATWYVISSIAFTINLMGILPVSPIDRGVYSQFDAFDVFIACTQFWMFVLLMIEAWQRERPLIATKKS